MALKLEKISNKGVVTTYHRIRNIMLNDSSMEVIVSEYITEEIRAFEKGLQENEVLRQELSDKINAELMKPQTEQDTKSIIEWTEQSNKLINTHVDSMEYELDYSVNTTKFEMPLDKEEPISYSDIYEKLKELPEFEDAEDV